MAQEHLAGDPAPRGVLPESYRAKYDELWGQGWRLHLLEQYVAGDSVRYDAVWLPGTMGEFQLYDASHAALVKRINELWNDGWRNHLLTAYEKSGSSRYSAVWRQA